ncbi:hypothetical protein J2848_001451 [Azospirillum lipoferum]|uniref:Uncharacterized protein n=1 Tax=Azospirillum lipoferum TaxID=193 RepID=A0A5A9GUX5_AZOLI|nr:MULTISPECIES: hypothetical protein [Azospirillum]KAA0598216.1 hypothetical protein FZ942_03780 [Azospirillum lipoferum]MCP1609804.1 hypothetical protein [Azospirillum lipoferum]MDW5534892.1 hypothetical protein [Azospirillum sp. NL1]
MPSRDPERREAASREQSDRSTVQPDTDPDVDIGTRPLTPGELNAMWRLNRLEQPTFDDLTRGLCLGLVWCMAMWTPMFVSALT